VRGTPIRDRGVEAVGLKEFVESLGVGIVKLERERFTASKKSNKKKMPRPSEPHLRNSGQESISLEKAEEASTRARPPPEGKRPSSVKEKG